MSLTSDGVTTTKTLAIGKGAPNTKSQEGAMAQPLYLPLSPPLVTFCNWKEAR